MTALLNSLPLDWDTWDLELDDAGNWNLFTSTDSSTAQDVACALRTFLGDCWYNQLLGLPYYQDIFGQNPPVSYLSAKLIAQALTMNNTQSLVVVALGLTADRVLTGTTLVYPLGSSLPLTVNF